MLLAATTGFASAFSLIFAIGAQNAFVLRQGILRQHVFWLCLFCAASDAVLISAGVLGFAAVSARFPMLPDLMTWGGAAFLLAYGALRFRAAWRRSTVPAASTGASGLWAVLGTAAALTWLNPHVYLDTLALIGAISTKFPLPADKTAFGLGAIAASFVFFFSLGYGARLLAPVMRSPRAWRYLDALIGVVMWALAAKLLLS